MDALELTLTLNPERLRETAAGHRFDIVGLLRAAVPSVRLVAGNVQYAVTVALDPREEVALRKAIEGFCTVAPRTFVELFDR